MKREHILRLEITLANEYSYRSLLHDLYLEPTTSFDRLLGLVISFYASVTREIFKVLDEM